MLSLNLVRWGGLAAILGGALFFAKILWDTTDVVPTYNTDVTDAVFFLVPLLWLVGLAGFYVRRAGRYGALGKTGFIMGLSGLAAGFVGSLVGVWIEPLRLLYWLGFRFLCIGLLLLGIATIRARTLPRGWDTLPLILGSLGLGRAVFMFLEATMGATGLAAPKVQGVLGAFLSSWAGTIASMLGLLFGLGWAWLGYALWTGKAEAVQQPASAG